MKINIFLKIMLISFIIFAITMGRVIAYQKKPMVIKREGRVESKKNANAKWTIIFGQKMIENTGAVRTSDKSSAKVEFWNNKTYLILEEKCRLYVVELADKKQCRIVAFKQDKGKIWVKVEKVDKKKIKFTIKTPQALLAVRGTIFYVRVGNANPSKGIPKELHKDHEKLKGQRKTHLSNNEKFKNILSEYPPLSGMITAQKVNPPVDSAQNPPSNLKGYTRVGVVKGEVSLKAPGFFEIIIKDGQTAFIWDGELPILLGPDPTLKSKKASTVADEVPGFSESDADVSSDIPALDPSIEPHAAPRPQCPTHP